MPLQDVADPTLFARACPQLGEYDIVLTTYDILRTDAPYAHPAPERLRRHEVRYPRELSPLVCVAFWRVCLDEAQMIETTTAKVARMWMGLPATLFLKRAR